MDPQIDMGPEVEPGTHDILVVHREPGGLDDVKRGVGGSGQPGDVPGVRRNLRFDQGDV